ncbi:MAG: CapA family protein [Acidobacteria bacterium]|nr:CapA family protein [Acidobacteriota bacterium]
MTIRSDKGKITVFIFGIVFFAACQFGSENSSESGNSGAPKNDRANLSSPSPSPKFTPSSSRIKIAAGGDVMLGSPVPNDKHMPPNDGKDLLKPVTPIFQLADLAFANLEGPLADGGISEKCKPESKFCFAFRMPTRYAAYLKAAGLDVVSVANNHALDFGDAGRASTRKALDAAGIKHAGSDSGKFSTAYFEVNGKTIAVIGFAHNRVSLNINNIVSARRAVETADRNADIVIVSFHGGSEGTNAQRVPNRTEVYLNEERGNLPRFARAVVDAGADLVLGHGPHVLRGMEIYKDRLIAYSLGNFAIYGWFKLAGPTATTLVLEVDLDQEGKFIGGKIHPFKLRSWGFLTPDKTNAAVSIVRRLSLLDFPGSAPVISGNGIIDPRS